MWQFRVDVKVPAYFWRRQRAESPSRHSPPTKRATPTRPTAVDLAGADPREYAEAQTARKLIDLYQKSVIPGRQLALESSMASYQTGTLDFLSRAFRIS